MTFSRYSLFVSFALLLLFIVHCVQPCLAHIEFEYDTGLAGEHGFYTVLKVPHGCMIKGVDNGDGSPTASVALPTVAFSVTVPADFPTVVPGVIPSWSLTRSLAQVSNGFISTFNYTAQPGYELLYWQGLMIPFVFTLPSPTVNTTYFIPAIQYCTSSVSVSWGNTTGRTNPSPSIKVTVSNVNGASSGVSSSSSSSSSDTDHRIGIAAIILAAIAIALLMTLVVAVCFGCTGSYKSGALQDFADLSRNRPSSAHVELSQH